MSEPGGEIRVTPETVKRARVVAAEAAMPEIRTAGATTGSPTPDGGAWVTPRNLVRNPDGATVPVDAEFDCGHTCEIYQWVVVREIDLHLELQPAPSATHKGLCLACGECRRIRKMSCPSASWRATLTGNVSATILDIVTVPTGGPSGE